ncbi:DUF2723 domain-containing protein [Candidatus Curtissbacteria bacterium]|nr:DUF2723 domain-containing protein [Candidatus Curtissbacteria bacterium]
MALVPILISIFFLIVYSQGVSPTSLGGDSGDIILSYFAGGVAHPPGYPLNTLLGYVFTHGPLLLINKPFVWRANFVSAVYQAVTLGLLYLLVKRLTGSVAAALIASLTLGFTALFWIYAHNAEVFQLTGILIVLSLIYLFKWWPTGGKKKGNLKDLALSLFFLGTAVFHHQTVLLLLPAYLLVLWVNRKEIYKLGNAKWLLLISFLLGSVVYVYDIWQSYQLNFYNWVNVVDLKSFIRLISRSDYGTFTATNQLLGSTFQQRFVEIIWYFRVFTADFSSFGVALFVAGLIFSFVKKRNLFGFLFLAWFFTGPFFLFYAAFPINESFTAGVSERFILTSYIFVAILVGFGVVGTVEILKRVLIGRYIKRSKIFELVIWGFLLLPLALFVANWHKTDLSNYQIGGIYARDILASAKPPGIIFPYGDTPGFNIGVSYFIEGQNNESYLIQLPRLGDPIYRENLIRRYSNLSYPDSFKSKNYFTGTAEIREFINSNVDKTPIYFGSEIQFPENFETVRQGLLLRLYRKGTTPSADDLVANMSQISGNFQLNLAQERAKYLQFFAEQILSDYASAFNSMGRTLLNRGKDQDALPYFNRALLINPNLAPAYFNIGVVQFESGQCKNAEETFGKIIVLEPRYWQAYEGLSQVYKNCYKDETRARDYQDKADGIKNKGLDKPVKEL